jgi:hypothetical protein
MDCCSFSVSSLCWNLLPNFCPIFIPNFTIHGGTFCSFNFTIWWNLMFSFQFSSQMLQSECNWQFFPSPIFIQYFLHFGSRRWQTQRQLGYCLPISLPDIFRPLSADDIAPLGSCAFSHNFYKFFFCVAHFHGQFQRFFPKNTPTPPGVTHRVAMRSQEVLQGAANIWLWKWLSIRKLCPSSGKLQKPKCIWPSMDHPWTMVKFFHFLSNNLQTFRARLFKEKWLPS